LRLRDVRASDRDRVLAWRNQPDVAQWMFTDHVITSQEHEKWFTAMLRDRDVKYWIIENDDVALGVIHLTSISSTHEVCEWGMYLGEQSARGTGAAEGAAFLSIDFAFSELGVQRVTCEVIAGNERALRLYERVGFRHEGLLRSHVTKAGEPHDVVLMAILRTEWADLRSELIERLRQRNLITG
jgi:UDP-4-amino-4,6-dideoxy-N-acetyl-beta-L-altrosamine N-acetyltransferase